MVPQFSTSKGTQSTFEEQMKAREKQRHEKKKPSASIAKHNAVTSGEGEHHKKS